MCSHQADMTGFTKRNPAVTTMKTTQRLYYYYKCLKNFEFNFKVAHFFQFENEEGHFTFSSITITAVLCFGVQFSFQCIYLINLDLTFLIKKLSHITWTQMENEDFHKGAFLAAS